jgi:hypothetical protein
MPAVNKPDFLLSWEPKMWDLVSPGAPQEILAFNPSAQIIVMLRYPVDVLHALHSQRLFCGSEHITRFESALDSEETR